jgi:hypothetical protein
VRGTKGFYFYNHHYSKEIFMPVKRSLFLSAALALLCICLASCGGSDKPNYGDILHDKAAMAKFTEALKALGKGKEVMIFQSISLTIGSANINIQDPDDPAKIVHHSWSVDRGWTTAPVTLKGDGNLEDNLSPMSAFNFAAMVDFILEAEKLAADKGYKDFHLLGMYIPWSWNDGSLSLTASGPVGKPGEKQANFTGTMDGKVTKAEISWFNDETKRQELESLL